MKEPGKKNTVVIMSSKTTTGRIRRISSNLSADADRAGSGRRYGQGGRPCGGFTLVELLVVIAIIGILIALLLPAVQAARAAARRMHNTNNLKQIGAALAMYHNTHNYYPSGRSYSSNQYGLTWSFYLLPFMEQNDIFEAHDHSLPVFDEANTISMRTTVSTFINPMRQSRDSDRPFDNNGQTSPLLTGGAAGDYAANVGYQVIKWGTGEWEPDKSGPFLQNANTVRISQVTDGTSHTLAVGDRFIPKPGHSIEKYDTNFYSDHAFFSGDHPATCCRSSDAGFPTGLNDPDWKKFGNNGYDMTAFVYLDGHVEWLDNSMSLTVYRYLSVCADGQTISKDAY